MSPFDSIHDIKASRNHLVFCDLPFKLEPRAVRGSGPRTIANQDVTQLWIVAKEDLRRTPPGDPVTAVEVRIPVPDRATCCSTWTTTTGSCGSTWSTSPSPT